ncbi:hypothetical protein B0H17DRAFT_1204539 [Mycena rosella]|uniref:Uncharacterized protein n=1 Tax=Mycena rosella TaxID=1033263 RepID=A0AAD7D9I8_MYCRO|nr:hypothetical protein B0H17DRAFT_1204539 [Mycena rosella]
MSSYTHTPEALRACALASKVLTPPAQRHIFHKITDLGEEAYISPQRLRDILTVSPYLAHHIRRVTICLDSESTAEIPSLGLTRGANVRATAQIIGLASVHRVRLMIASGDTAMLGSLFGACTPALKEVEFHLIDAVEELGDAFWKRGYQPKNARTTLACLRLRLGEHGAVVVESRLPARRLAALRRLLRDIGGLKKGFDPTRFSALTYLSVRTSMDYLDFPATMRGMDSHNAIREIVFSDTGYFSTNELEGMEIHLQAFDTAFTTLSLPALERVEMRMWSDRVPNLSTKIREWLPQLLARGVFLGITT